MQEKEIKHELEISTFVQFDGEECILGWDLLHIYMELKEDLALKAIQESIKLGAFASGLVKYIEEKYGKPPNEEGISLLFKCGVYPKEKVEDKLRKAGLMRRK